MTNDFNERFVREACVYEIYTANLPIIIHKLFINLRKQKRFHKLFFYIAQFDERLFEIKHLVFGAVC